MDHIGYHLEKLKILDITFGIGYHRTPARKGNERLEKTGTEIQTKVLAYRKLPPLILRGFSEKVSNCESLVVLRTEFLLNMLIFDTYIIIKILKKISSKKTTKCVRFSKREVNKDNK